MMEKIGKIEQHVLYIEKGAAIITLIGILIAITLQVLWRYFLNRPLAYTDEISRLLFVWVSFLGASVAYKTDSHVRIGILVDNIFNGRLAKYFQFISHLLVLFFLIILGIEGYRLTLEMANLISPGAKYPLELLYSTTFIWPLLMGFHVIIKLLETGQKIINQIREANTNKGKGV